MTHVLKPYPARKDSGLEWLGEVPEHWKIRRLKNVAEMRISNVDKHTKEGEYPVRLCNYVDVYKNDHISPSMLFMRATATADEIARFRLTPGDVLITKDSEAWDDIGVPALVVESADDLVSGYHLALLRPLGTCLNGGYLLRALQSRSIGCQFHVQANGVTRYGLSHAAIQSVWLLLPPLPEQAAISYFLDYADRRIQHYIRAKEKLIALLEEYRQAIIDQAVTGQIDVRTGEPYPAYKDSGVEWLGQVPEHWQVLQLGRFGQFFKGAGGTKEDEVERGVPCVRYGDLYTTHEFFIIKSRAYVTEEHVADYTPLRYGDVLFAGSGETIDEIGMSAVNLLRRDACCGGDVVVFRTRKECSAKFLGYATDCWTASTQKSTMGRGITVMHVYGKDLKYLSVALPPVQEQTAIVRFLEDATANMDAAGAYAGHQVELLREYRTRLIADVVTGKLDVRDAAAALPKVDPLAGDDMDDPLDPEVDAALQDLESRTEVII